MNRDPASPTPTIGAALSDAVLALRASTLRNVGNGALAVLIAAPMIAGLYVETRANTAWLAEDSGLGSIGLELILSAGLSMTSCVLQLALVLGYVDWRRLDRVPVLPIGRAFRRLSAILPIVAFEIFAQVPIILIDFGILPESSRISTSVVAYLVLPALLLPALPGVAAGKTGGAALKDGMLLVREGYTRTFGILILCWLLFASCLLVLPIPFVIPLQAFLVAAWYEQLCRAAGQDAFGELADTFG